MRNFDDNEFPQAYLITFRCYATWLHGDDRGSMRHKHTLVSARHGSTVYLWKEDDVAKAIEYVLCAQGELN